MTHARDKIALVGSLGLPFFVLYNGIFLIYIIFLKGLTSVDSIILINLKKLSYENECVSLMHIYEHPLQKY